MAVVKQAIEDRRRHHGIPEHGPHSPTARLGHQHGASLVASADQLEEQVRGVGLERQVAGVVSDQQLGLAEWVRAFLQSTVGMCLGQLRHQRRSRGEQPLDLGVRKVVLGPHLAQETIEFGVGQ